MVVFGAVRAQRVTKWRPTSLEFEFESRRAVPKSETYTHVADCPAALLRTPDAQITAVTGKDEERNGKQERQRKGRETVNRKETKKP